MFWWQVILINQRSGIMNHSQSNEQQPQPYGGTQLGLLILVMAVFIALWESDGKHHREVAAREAAKRQQIVAKRSPNIPLANGGQVAAVVERKAVPKDIPLPLGITPGEYRVVSSQGTVDSHTVTLPEIRRQGMKPGREARDFYLLDNVESRVYFIRVDSKTKVARRETASVR